MDLVRRTEGIGVTRPQIYLGIVLVACLAAGVLVVVSRPSPVALVVIAVVCLLPGRLQGILWRDFFRGRDALSAGQPADALTYFERFQTSLVSKPWLARAIYLAGSAYTWNAHAMVANNIGAARLLLGQVAEAERTLRDAAERDPDYSLALFNLGVVARLHGDESGAESLRQRAVQLGYTGGTRDRLLQLAASSLAALEGRPFRSDHARAGA